ncbi:hypothetical protein [Stenotrophomonas sp. YIM B06876]|uniref:hypothetical protein n=1 Tax=Stenotrophomonas sp. YIM B06876 TaxID=3060211 RepID=UPI00273817BA|nr:hypothetical protein [Stenotrophomonas sp. YIM B06876]
MPARPPSTRPPPRSGGLSLARLLFAAGVLLLCAWFIGNRKSPAADSGATADAHGINAAPDPGAPSSPQARVIHGEKSTTLATVDDARMSVDGQGEVLRIEGSVGRNFATGLQTLLETHPSLQRIDITSGGGYANAGLEAARMIRKRNLIVRVHSHCASMCVALWAAAAQRQMEPDAVIGLHQWNAQCDAFPSPAREECRYQIQFATDHDSSYDAWLRDAGFNQYLLDLQSRTAAEDIAVLTAPQLWANGVDFSVVARDGTRMSRAEVQRYLAAKTARR